MRGGAKPAWSGEDNGKNGVGGRRPVAVSHVRFLPVGQKTKRACANVPRRLSVVVPEVGLEPTYP